MLGQMMTHKLLEAYYRMKAETLYRWRRMFNVMYFVLKTYVLMIVRLW